MVAVYDSLGKFLSYTTPAKARILVKKNKAVGSYTDNSYSIKLVKEIVMNENNTLRDLVNASTLDENDPRYSEFVQNMNIGIPQYKNDTGWNLNNLMDMKKFYEGPTTGFIRKDAYYLLDTEEEVSKWADENYDEEYLAFYKTVMEFKDEQAMRDWFKSDIIRQWKIFNPILKNLDSGEFLFKDDDCGSLCVSDVENSAENLLNQKEYKFLNKKVYFGELLLMKCKCGGNSVIEINHRNFRISNDETSILPTDKISCQYCNTSPQYKALNGLSFSKLYNEDIINKMIEKKFDELFNAKFRVSIGGVFMLFGEKFGDFGSKITSFGVELMNTFGIKKS